MTASAVLPAAATARPAGGQPARPAATGFGIDRMVAVGAVVLTGLRVPLPLGVVPGLLVAVVLLPVWLPALRHYRGGRLLVVLAGIAVLNGWWLQEWAAADHRVDLRNAIGTTALLAGIVGGAGVLLWARRLLTDPSVAAWLAVGLIAAQFSGRGTWSDNPWKFAFVVPVSLGVLALARMTGRRLVETLALAGLGLYSALSDSRSAFALFLLAGAMTLWQVIPIPVRGRRRWLGVLRTCVLIGIVAGAVYNVGTALVVEGRLGAAAQERSLEQIERSGSLLLGGRPELAATLALMGDRPAGFGPGTLPNPADVLVAKAGMESIGYATDNGYVERFMFGTQIRLHSVLGELWAFFGPTGLALGVAAIGVLAVALATGLTARSASGFALWLTCLAAWNGLFGPLYGSAAALLAALGLVLARRESTVADVPGMPGVPPAVPGVLGVPAAPDAPAGSRPVSPRGGAGRTRRR